MFQALKIPVKGAAVYILEITHFQQNEQLQNCNTQCFKLKFSLSRPKMFRKFLSLYNLLQCTPDISRLCISRNWIYRGRMLDPIFWHPRTRYFSRNHGNSLDPIHGRQFFAKFAHRDRLCSRSAGDIFRETNSTSLPVNAGWNTCCVVVSHARRSIDTSIVSQSRVQLIQCQCKSWLQIANLGINNAFLIKSSLSDHAVYIRHLVQTLGQFRSESRARDW